VRDKAFARVRAPSCLKTMTSTLVYAERNSPVPMRLNALSLKLSEEKNLFQGETVCFFCDIC